MTTSTLIFSAAAANKIEAVCGTDVMVEAALAVSRHRRGVAPLPSFPEALASARKTFAACKAARAVFLTAQRGDDAIWFIKVGPRGGWTKIADLSA